MSKTNNRFIITNKTCDGCTFQHRKCCHNVCSHSYVANLKKHDEIVASSLALIAGVNMDVSINVKVAFHFLAPCSTYNREKVLCRAHDIILSLNDDFNNYSCNFNTMNNFKYKNIVNKVFVANMVKQNIYLSDEYLKFLPICPSNITFEFGQLYFYPVKSKLNLAHFNDITDVDIELQVIKQYIHQNRAEAIAPQHVLNIWIIDMCDTRILGFSNFPWEVIDDCHGVIINRRVFFPEDYCETNFACFKTITHHVGHYFGLPHVFNKNNIIGLSISNNINDDCEKVIEPIECINDICSKIVDIYEPIDKVKNRDLHMNVDYNPLFMNFMDLTFDKYVCMFTVGQIQKMRFMIFTYRPLLNSLTNCFCLPLPKYNPETNSISEIINTNASLIPSIPSKEYVENPRALAHKKEILNGTELVKLVPNLCVNNIPHINPKHNAREQILQNIQNNIPASNTINKEPEIYQESNPMPIDPMPMNPIMTMDPRFFYPNFCNPRCMPPFPFPIQHQRERKFENDEDIEETLFDSEINEEAVKNLRKQRAYPKYAQIQPSTKKNKLNPKYDRPSNLKEAIRNSNEPITAKEYVPVHMRNSNNGNCDNDLIEKFSRVGEELRNIKSVLPLLSRSPDAAGIKPLIPRSKKFVRSKPLNFD